MLLEASVCNSNIKIKKVTDLVPGSITRKEHNKEKYKKASGTNDESERPSSRDEEEQDNVIEVNAAPCVASWKAHRGFASDSVAVEDEEILKEEVSLMDITYSSTGWDSAMLSSRSILTTSHCVVDNYANDSVHPMYGVAFYTLSINNSRGGVNVMCEGVTFFPPNQSWILRGLLCIGKKLIPTAETVLDSQHSRIYSPMSTRCRRVRQLLIDLKRKSFQPDKDLIAAVDELFSDFAE
jgi:hypothetical protein